MVKESSVHFTPREQEVLFWIAEGWTSQQVADRLGIGKKAVDFHLGNIYQKLGVSSRTGACVKAVQLGLLPALFPHPSPSKGRLGGWVAWRVHRKRTFRFRQENGSLSAPLRVGNRLLS